MDNLTFKFISEVLLTKGLNYRVLPFDMFCAEGIGKQVVKQGYTTN